MPIPRRCAAGVALLALSVPIGVRPSRAVERGAGDPLLPAGVTLQDVHIEGQLAYLFSEPDGTQVIHVVGDFTLRAGDRKLSAAQGIVWMATQRERRRPYHALEVFLYRDARLQEPAGTVTEGPLLFVTLATAGDIFLAADRRAFASSADTSLFRDAAALRERVRRGTLGGGAPAVSAPVTVTPERFAEPPIPPEFHFSADQTGISQLDDGRSIITCIGHVDVFRGATGTIEALELLADVAVVFLQPPEDASDGTAPPLLTEAGGRGPSNVESVYLEGDIRMTLGDRTIRASRLYYDLLSDRALILDAVAHAMVTERDLPIYLRAARIRQLSDRRYTADDAILTTSEFHTPHYHVGTDHIELIDKTPRTYFGGRGGLARATYKMGPSTFRLNNVPILYWPGAAGRVTLADSAVRRVSAGFDDDFGARLETKWDLFSLLSWEPPEGVTADLGLDVFSERGPAIGLNVDYERDDYFGLFRGYGIDDRGDDNLGRFRDNERSDGTRGRFTWRHRHFLPDDWELTLELSYISDRAFLEEFFESEFDEGKDQESLIYLKKQRDNWAFTALAHWRLNDFFTRTERLPDFSFRVVGQPLGDFASWYSENRAGLVRYRAAEKEFFILVREGSDGPSSSTTARIDSRQELTFPLKWGPVNVVPFVSIRGSAWERSRRRTFFSPIGGFDDGGGVQRVFATYGVRAAMYFSRVFPNVRNNLLDIHGVRHIIKPELVAWVSESNRDPDDLFPFDEDVERIDDFDGVLLGLHQRWQTKRGQPPSLPPSQRRTNGGPDLPPYEGGTKGGADLPPYEGGTKGGSARIVDLLTLDVDVGLFNDGGGDRLTNGFISYSRPENSVPRNFVNSAANWRINDSTLLLGEMNYDLNDGEVDRLDLALQVDRTPRFSYGLDYRFIEETDSNLLGFGMNYRADEKHTFAIRELFDLERGRTHDFSVGYVRKFPRWFVAVTFDLDEAEDNAGVTLSIWPEGLPRAAVGTRRFTGLATSTALRPEN